MLVSLSDNVVKVESSVKYFQRTTEVYLKDEHVFYMTRKFSKTQIICLKIPILHILPCDLAQLSRHHGKGRSPGGEEQ